VVQKIYFCVGIPAAGNAIDFTPPSGNATSTVVISYADASTIIPSMNWTLEKLSTINDDNLLDPSELFMITIDVANTGNVTIGPYHRFALEVKPPGGAVLPIERTTPPRVNEYVNLH